MLCNPYFSANNSKISRDFYLKNGGLTITTIGLFKGYVL